MTVFRNKNTGEIIVCDVLGCSAPAQHESSVAHRHHDGRTSERRMVACDRHRSVVEASFQEWRERWGDHLTMAVEKQRESGAIETSPVVWTAETYHGIAIVQGERK